MDGSFTRFRRGCPAGPRERRRAFTLIELLTVIAIIAILAAVTLGAVRGVKQRAAVQKARVELAVIAQGLTAYRARYGDYPQAATPAQMLQALLGRRNPDGDPMTGRAMIDSGRFVLSSPDHPDAPTTSLLDPWGNPYHYRLFPNGDAHSFILYSAGPDGKYLSPVALNAQNRDAPENLDNIYANP